VLPIGTFRFTFPGPKSFFASATYVFKESPQLFLRFDFKAVATIQLVNSAIDFSPQRVKRRLMARFAQ
jgi:hypothetical protein